MLFSFVSPVPGIWLRPFHFCFCREIKVDGQHFIFFFFLFCPLTCTRGPCCLFFFSYLPLGNGAYTNQASKKETRKKNNQKTTPKPTKQGELLSFCRSGPGQGGQPNSRRTCTCTCVQPGQVTRPPTSKRRGRGGGGPLSQHTTYIHCTVTSTIHHHHPSHGWMDGLPAKACRLSSPRV